MRRTAAYVTGKVPALVGDHRVTYATPDRLYPLMNLAQDEMIISVFSNETVSGIEGIIVVPAVASQATSLAQYLALNQPLYGLTSIMSMKERQAGQDIDAWTQMAAVLGDMPVRRQESYNVLYKWTGVDILLIGATQSLDFRVYGKFNAAEITSGDSVLIPSSEAIMIHRTAALLSLGRNKELYEALESRARDLEDELLITLMREKQSIDLHQIPGPGYPSEPLYL